MAKSKILFLVVMAILWGMFLSVPTIGASDAEMTIKIIPSVNDTFGYDILMDGKLLIHQPSIPGLPGVEGFITKEWAQKVAEFVRKKIRNNEMPPTVTIEDLNNMGVLK